MVTSVTQGLVAPQDCVHEWLIDSPHGARSEGYCGRCHVRGVFFNSIPDEVRINNSDIFTSRRPGTRDNWSEVDTESELRAMYARR